MTDALSLWTVYAPQPADYPGQFVARLFRVQDGQVIATEQALFSATLDGVRAQLPPGLVPLPRQPGDEPQIVETWL